MMCTGALQVYFDVTEGAKGTEATNVQIVSSASLNGQGALCLELVVNRLKQGHIGKYWGNPELPKVVNKWTYLDALHGILETARFWLAEYSLTAGGGQVNDNTTRLLTLMGSADLGSMSMCWRCFRPWGSQEFLWDPRWTHIWVKYTMMTLCVHQFLIPRILMGSMCCGLTRGILKTKCSALCENPRHPRSLLA